MESNMSYTDTFKHGWGGVLRGAAIVFFAFIGFDAVSTAAQEAKNPKRDMPIGILGSLVVCTILYILFSYVLTGVAPSQNFVKLDEKHQLLMLSNSYARLWMAGNCCNRCYSCRIFFSNSGDANGTKPCILHYVQ